MQSKVDQLSRPSHLPKFTAFVVVASVALHRAVLDLQYYFPGLRGDGQVQRRHSGALDPAPENHECVVAHGARRPDQRHDLFARYQERHSPRH